MNLQSEIKNIVHKSGVNPEDWTRVHKNLLLILEYVIDHCHTYNLPLVISSIIRPRIKGASKTDIHAKRRAFDISVRGWGGQDIDFLVTCINKDMTIGARSISDGQEREAVYEPDEFKIVEGKKVQIKWAHIHFQVRN